MGIEHQLRKRCSGCGTINEPSSAYCYRCGLELSDSVQPAAVVVGNPAGFWIRLLAWVIDSIVVYVITIGLAPLFGRTFGDGAEDLLLGDSYGVLDVVNVALSLLYYTFTTGRWGQTVGKAVLGLKVVRRDDTRVSYWRSFARWWAYLVSAFPFGLGFVAIALSSQKLGVHDWLSDTRVVRTRM